MIKTSQIISAKGYMYTFKHVNSVLSLKFCAHQHKLMYALCLCLTLFENKGPFLCIKIQSISDTDFLSNVLKHWINISHSDLTDRTSVRSEWLILIQCFSSFPFGFSAQKDMILLGILASTPMNDCEMTCLRSSRQTKRQYQRTTYK